MFLRRLPIIAIQARNVTQLITKSLDGPQSGGMKAFGNRWFPTDDVYEKQVRTQPQSQPRLIFLRITRFQGEPNWQSLGA